MNAPAAPEFFRGHLPALDGVRGLAILGVMLCHFMLRPLWPDERLWNVVHSGWLGVDLFFVLSGFLITGILIDARGKPHYWKNFYRRRLLRIFPLYYAVVIITWLVIIFIEKAPDRLQGYDSFLWFFAFAPNIAIALKGEWLYHSHILNLNHLWSLAVEEQFYLVWPLIARYLPLRYLLLLCALLLHFSTPLRHHTDHLESLEKGIPYLTHSVPAYVLPWCRMDGLAAGAFLAVWLRLGLHQYVPYSRWIARILLVWMAVKLFDGMWNGATQYQFTVSALCFVALLYLALNPHPKALVRRVCENPVLRHFGKYSFGLYVFHHMFQLVWLRYFGNDLIAQVQSGALPVWAAQTAYQLLAFAGTYALARLSWLVLEGPFLRLK